MKPQRLRLILAAVFWAVTAEVLANTNAPLDPTMTQLLQQAATEANVAADAGFDPSIIAVDDTAVYRVVVTAEPEAVHLPENIPAPRELKLNPGGVGQSFVANNPQATYDFYVTPRAEGVFTIPEFVLGVGSRQFQIPARTLTVVAAGSSNALHAVRLQVEVPPGNFYIGQTIPLQLVALDPGDNSLFGLVEPKATGDGFIFDPVKGSQRRELREVQGHSYSALIEEITAIPIHEGKLAVAAQVFAERRVAANEPGIRLPGYRPFLESAPVEIEVKHLPAGALPGFTGLIGQFQSATPKLLIREVHAGDPFDLPVAVEGEGNLGRLLPPVITNSPLWRVMPGTGNSGLSVNGSKAVFHYTLIPQIPGMAPTPSIPFSYFNPEENRYVDLTIPSIQVLVLPPVGGRHTVESNSVAANPPAQTGGLGRMAPRPVHFSATLQPWQQRPVFWRWQLSIGAMLAGWYGWQRRRDYLAAHPERVKVSQARRELRRLARRRLQAFKDRHAAAYVRESVTSLRVVCAANLHARPEALVCDDVLATLPPPARENENLVRELFHHADELSFKAKWPSAETIWARQAEIEDLLTELRRRLC